MQGSGYSQWERRLTPIQDRVIGAGSRSPTPLRNMFSVMEIESDGNRSGTILQSQRRVNSL